MTLAKLTTFVIYKYLVLVLLGFLALAVAGLIIRKKNRAAGGAILLAAAAIAIYMVSHVASGVTYFGKIKTRAHTNGKTIALTFDDGPSVKYTIQVLRVLRRNHAHATFFVLGEAAERNPGLLRRMAAEGHEIACHSYSHKFFFTMSTNRRKQDIIRAMGVAKAAAGREPKIFRAPYEYRDLRLIRLLDGMGLTYAGHSLRTGDVANPDAGEIAVALLRAHPGDIALMHDSRGNRTPTVEALEKALPALSARGFRFVTVSEVLKSEGKNNK